MIWDPVKPFACACIKGYGGMYCEKGSNHVPSECVNVKWQILQQTAKFTYWTSLFYITTHIAECLDS